MVYSPLKYSPFKRYPNNPIIRREDIPYTCNTVFNAAACKYKDEYILLLRVEDLYGKSHFTIARSKDGINFEISDKPWITSSSDPEFEPYERYGIEDPRITPIDGKYYITYSAFGPYGVRIGIGVTEDFVSFKRISLATEVDNKDGVLFPEKIKGKYAMITRPSGGISRRGDMWISFSPDLIYWGEAKVLMFFSPGMWGNQKVGASVPPIKTDKGWLVIFHGVKNTSSGSIYRVGALLLDLKDPTKIKGFTQHYILGPEELYERIGDTPNVVFPCGAVLEENGELKLYYGVADTAIALATADINEIIYLCEKCEDVPKQP